MAIAPLATDCTFGDYAAAAPYIYIYESWTAETSDTSSIDSWGREMYRHSLQPQYRNQLFTPSFCSIECQRGRKKDTFAYLFTALVSLHRNHSYSLPYLDSALWDIGNQLRLIDTLSAATISRSLYTIYYNIYYYNLVRYSLIHFPQYIQAFLYTSVKRWLEPLSAFHTCYRIYNRGHLAPASRRVLNLRPRGSNLAVS